MVAIPEVRDINGIANKILCLKGLPLKRKRRLKLEAKKTLGKKYITHTDETFSCHFFLASYFTLSAPYIFLSSFFLTEPQESNNDYELMG